MVITLVWGIGLITEAALATLAVFSLPPRAYLLAGPVLGYGMLAALGLWTFWFSRRQGAKVDAEKALKNNVASAST
jgi:hypothetical protein